MQVQVIEKPLPYGKRRYGIGDPIDMPDKHAYLLIAVGRVRRMRALSRSDIPAAPLVDVVPVELSPRTGKPKRQYHRRDMRADD